jgi:outer membrane protein assembly factor BamB
LATLTLSSCGGGARATSWTDLAINDQVIYAADLASIVALDKETGEVVWDSADEADLEGLGPFYTVNLLPETALFVTSQERSGGGLFAQPRGVLRALEWDADDVLWQFTGTTGYYIAPGIVTDNMLIIGNGDGLVYALDAEDGSEVWSFDTGGRVWSTPLVISDTVYVTSLSHRLYALDLATGREVWDGPLETGGAMTAQPLPLDDLLFVGAFDSKIYAVHQEDGSLAWPQPFEGQAWFWGSPATDGTDIYIADVNGNVYAIQAETGTLRWQEAVEGPVARKVLLSPEGDFLLVGNDAGDIIILDTQDGRVLETHDGIGPLGSMALEGHVLYVTRILADQRIKAFEIEPDDIDLLWEYPQPEDN